MMMTMIKNIQKIGEYEMENVKVPELEPRIINLTPHDIHVVDKDGEVHVFAKAENPARCFEELVETSQVGNFQLTVKQMGAIQGLPDKVGAGLGIYFVVSRVVYEQAIKLGRDCSDLLIPGDAVRDDNGRIIGSVGFSKLP